MRTWIAILFAAVMLTGCGPQSPELRDAGSPPARYIDRTEEPPDCSGSEGTALFDEYAEGVAGEASVRKLALGYAESGESLYFTKKGQLQAHVVIGTPDAGRILVTMHNAGQGWLADGVLQC